MNNKWLGAIIGGIGAGVLTLIPILNFCCFIWAIAAGFFAFWLWAKDMPTTPSMAEAAKLGAITGGIAAGVTFLINIPLLLLGIGTAGLSSRTAAGAGVSSGLMAVGSGVSMLVGAVFLVGFAVGGAILAQVMLNKQRSGSNTPPTAPPPPSPAV